MSAYVNDNNLYLNIHNNLFTMSIFELALQKKHNLYNSMAAGVAARIDMTFARRLFAKALQIFAMQNIGWSSSIPYTVLTLSTIQKQQT